MASTPGAVAPPGRFALVEVMGRTQGWIATYAGMAAGADAIERHVEALRGAVVAPHCAGAGFGDLLDFFKRLPNPDKQFAVMPGISHASFHQINYMLVYHILYSFFTQPGPIYRG